MACMKCGGSMKKGGAAKVKKTKNNAERWWNTKDCWYAWIQC
jgi:PHP family Zn ribbon phosphoesterase